MSEGASVYYVATGTLLPGARVVALLLGARGSYQYLSPGNSALDLSAYPRGGVAPMADARDRTTRLPGIRSDRILPVACPQLLAAFYPIST